MTPFHYAIHFKNDLFFDEMICYKGLIIEWKKKTRGRNLLHFAIIADNLR